MKRLLALASGALVVVGVAVLVQRGAPKAIPPECAGPPLHDVAKREEAMTEGYTINRMHDCIDKASYDAIQAERARVARLKAEREAARTQAAATPPEPAMPVRLAEARKALRTTVAVRSNGRPPLPVPPPDLFVRLDYPNGAGLSLPAFVTPDPRDGAKHPAIVWLTGGDTNSLDAFWAPGQGSYGDVVHAFRDAGVVMMFPTLRGGNANPGAREYFLGEVDDVLAAFETLSGLPYVDREHVYLAGHSTGGTLALLVSETSPAFASVFAFGPAARADEYPRRILGVDLAFLPAAEVRPRSPLYWRDEVRKPTYVIEGRGGNIEDLEQLCAGNANAMLRCIPVPGADHFSVLPMLAKVIAARIAMASEGVELRLRPEEFAQ